MGHRAQGKIVGVDVGGTFTDLVLLEPGGKVQLAKVPSTLDNQAYGVLDALKAVQADLKIVDLIVHGTTTTTNAVLERKLCKTGLITTQGFRDVLELGRRTRPQAYGMFGEFTPVIPRDLRIEVPERLYADGAVHTPLDHGAVKEAAGKLLAAGCESVVIHFLHSYANPSHEQAAAGLVADIWPNEFITMGHALLSESREFERGVTAAVNASVQPLLQRYVDRLEKELSEQGYEHDVLVMNGNGGMVSASMVAREAAKTVMSGPASGVMAAAYTGARAGMENLITYDMGGTSTDVALIRNAQPAVSNEIEIEYAMPIHVPMVDVRTVGAGGGSIAHVNAAGLLVVGPESAGATPGPICYDKGGSKPTITDANLLLGRMGLRNDATTGLMDRVTEGLAGLAGPLGTDPVGAAEAVIRVANTHMAGAIRMVSVSLGVDPRDFALFAFGGAGPLHASALARELGVPKVLVPARPGITNALGCVVADLRHDYVRTVNRPLDGLDAADIHAIFSEQAALGEAQINREKIALTGVRHLYSVDMQFIGQTHLLRVGLDSGTPTVAELQKRFEQAYFDRFQVKLDDIRANLVNVNTSVIGQRPPLDLSLLIDPSSRKATLEMARKETRKVMFDGAWHDTPVYWRDHLPLDAEIHGPAIIEQMDTTIVIEPPDVARGDAEGNIIISIGGRHDN